MQTTRRSTGQVSVPSPNEPDIDQLVDRTRLGDTDALSRLFTRYAETVRRTAYRLTLSADEADDVVQEVFVGLPEALRRYAERGSFEGWLKTIAVRVALMRLRAASARGRALETLGSTSVVADAETEHADRISLTAALARLSVEHRTVFILKTVEGYSHDEIGELLGIRRGTSEVRLYRAIRQLRAHLGNA